MTGTVIIFASSITGNTRKTAEYLAKVLGADIFDLKLQTRIDLSAYGKVILGTGIHAGHPYGRLVRFIEDNRSVLNDKSVSLFATCLYKGERAGRQIIDIAHELNLADYTYFSSRSERNQDGISVDADVFAERMRS